MAPPPALNLRPPPLWKTTPLRQPQLLSLLPSDSQLQLQPQPVPVPADTRPASQYHAHSAHALWPPAMIGGAQPDEYIVRDVPVPLTMTAGTAAVPLPLRLAAGPSPPGDTPVRVLRIGVLALQGAFVEHVASLQRLAPELMRSERIRLEVSLVRTGGQLRGAPEEPPLLHGLILPGGESTTMRRMLQADSSDGMMESLRAYLAGGGVAFGTCAGCILLADRVVADAQVAHGKSHPSDSDAIRVSASTSAPSSAEAWAPSSVSSDTTPPLCSRVGGLGMSVVRNYYGRQLASFRTDEVQLHDAQLTEGGDIRRDQTDEPQPQPAGLASEVKRQRGDGGVPARCTGVFIRAPAIVQCDSKVRVLATLPHAQTHRRRRAMLPDGAQMAGSEADTDSRVTAHLACTAAPSAFPSVSTPGATSPVIVAVRSANLLATCFHPELTSDLRWHRYFVQMAVLAQEQPQSAHIRAGVAKD